MARARPVGTITRGTTGPNRLRRCDRWIAGPQGWRLRRSEEPPVVVDLGYGASPVTALEMHTRLAVVRPDLQVVGIEIDPARVEAAQPLERDGLSFRRGGFEVPLDGGRHATVVRAFNVLRQYPEHDVDAAWDRVRERLTPDGLLIDGTCDEIGRRAAWVAVDRHGPVSLTISLHLRGLEHPSDVAERLPKSLIHRNVAGERVHDYLGDLDRTWARHAPASSWGARQRFLAVAAEMRERWPLLDGPSRWRLGELTVAWGAVAPLPAPTAFPPPVPASGRARRA
ncbi:MAG: class I SAM-dependent methyltransferase [Humibacillus sp.]|nr:class I SAM-dependent methyltransferase [Humibacillus sp.]MDN5779619.1 class I SAM-dependent methyltransferase [Humibacillus sp.]